ncbi:hypothetical protein CEG14_18520 [Bordetella genomosp. 1]|uniref:Lipoprotein n=2 Tax=Bordetella genomosp. 1 TaxID=1395607 RepID=A0A261S7C6_9BORD|nr:hypothetical protein CEG14_18520 [Bordetella genomosp. 1]OZI65767.1 hypothetical protein CAL27_12230 [Bordetella genomosp. 1]
MAVRCRAAVEQAMKILLRTLGGVTLLAMLGGCIVVPARPRPYYGGGPVYVQPQPYYGHPYYVHPRPYYW